MIQFADSYALIALLNPRDVAHTKVKDHLAKFTGRLLTTEWVLVELADALSMPHARPTVVDFLKTIRSDPLFEVVGYLPSLYAAGFDLFSNRTDKAWSLTDCISFVVMTDRGLTDALTGDHHFEQAGFHALFK